MSGVSGFLTFAQEYQFPPQYKVIETAKDGNCLFSGTADQLGRPMADCHAVRLELVQYVHDHHSDMVRSSVLLKFYVLLFL